MNNAKLQLEVVSPTTIKCGYVQWHELDTKLVGKVGALINRNKSLQQENEELQTTIDKAIKDLKLTKEKNVPFLDKYGNALICIDIDHINYLIKILKGEENE